MRERCSKLQLQTVELKVSQRSPGPRLKGQHVMRAVRELGDGEQASNLQRCGTQRRVVDQSGFGTTRTAYEAHCLSSIACAHSHL